MEKPVAVATLRLGDLHRTCDCHDPAAVTHLADQRRQTIKKAIGIGRNRVGIDEYQKLPARLLGPPVPPLGNRLAALFGMHYRHIGERAGDLDRGIAAAAVADDKLDAMAPAQLRREERKCSCNQLLLVQRRHYDAYRGGCRHSRCFGLPHAVRSLQNENG